MSNRHPPFDVYNRGHSHVDPFSMDYINRALDRYSRSSRRSHNTHFSAPPPSPAPIHQIRSPRHDTHRPHKRKHRRHKMTAFNGPWSQDLDALKKAVQSMPDQYKSSFVSASKDTFEKVCDPDVLHVWESDSDIDNLFQLTSLIAKLCNLGTRKTKGANAGDGSMVIIAEEKFDRNNFVRICQLVEYLTGADGKKHLDGAVVAFSSIVVVRGWNNSVRVEKGRQEAEKTVKRVNTVLERVFKMSSFAARKLVWHHGPVIHFLLHWINTTTSPLRSTLAAITITGSLDLGTSVAPSIPGRANTLEDLKLLETYATKLGIPIVFLDSTSLGLTYQHLNTYMYYYAYYIRTFLPPSILRPHLHAAQDSLVTFAFRLLGASKNKYQSDVVKKVKATLDPSIARKWARMCVDEASYEKNKCRNSGSEEGIHGMVQLADAPFLRFNHDKTNALPAFARLAVGPAAAASQASYTAAPVSISFATSKIRPSYPTPFHILIPSKDADDTDKITAHVQGLMMAVLERVRQEHATPPPFSGNEIAMWKETRKAVEYALKKSDEGVPKKVSERVQYVREKMGRGTWGYLVGCDAKEEGDGDGGSGIGEAARANRAAEKVYGRQQMGGYGGGAQQIPGFGAGTAQQGMVAPPNSPGLGQPLHMDTCAQQGVYAPAPQLGYGYGATPRGYGQQQHGDLAYAQSQGVGVSAGQLGRRGGAYPPAQSMGGPWM
jgi:hypothetical protein